MGAGRVLAQPSGASVVAGQAQVSTAGATTLINQSTNKAIINWQDFSVGAGASVQFNQPSAASITLNRVTGANISNIEGAVRANGQVWLLNPNGVLFGNNARINVGGLLATTSDIANQDFIEGRYNFSGGRNSVINKGAITASSGGSVVLSAPTVINHGLIRANAGHVVLGGTDTFTVDFNGDHLLSYAVGANSSGGKVTNTGKISASGGTILLTAKAAAGVQDAVINNSGMVEATSVREENGEIILEAEDGGVANSGTLDASGKGTGETGGTVKVLGKDVAITDGASIDVSGDAGGGTALIGGNFHGKGSEQHARATTIGKATIKADAVARGNGGKVVVWSDGTTRFAGAISARGGAGGGNGGQVETSGHYLGVEDGAIVNTAALRGISGNWLLDPDNITIATGGGAGVNQTFASSGDVTIAPATIESALGSGNVTLQANNDITVTDAVMATSANTLEVEAGHSIILNNTLQNLGGSIGLYAGNPNASGGSVSGAVISGSGVVRASTIQASLGNASGSIGTSGTPLQIDGSSGTDLDLSVQSLGANAYIATASGFAPPRVVIYNTYTPQMPGIPNHQGVNLDSGTFNLTSSQLVIQGWGITADALNVTMTNGASAMLSDNGVPVVADLGNMIGGDATFITDGGDVTFNNAYNGLTLLGPSSIGGNFSVTAAAIAGSPSSPTTTYHSISIDSSFSVTGNTSLTGASIDQDGPITTNDLYMNATSGSINMPQSNTVFGVARLNSFLDTTFTMGNAILPAFVLGNSSVGGVLTVNAPTAILELADPNGGSVSAVGAMTLSAKAITQRVASNIALSAASLDATATGTGTGGISLTDPAGGSSPRNAVSSASFLVAPGKGVAFYNSTDLALGPVYAGLDVQQNPIAAGNVDIQLNGAHQLSLSSDGQGFGGIFSNGDVNLLAPGGILYDAGAGITATSLTMATDTGGVGNVELQIPITAYGSGPIALSVTTNGADAYLFSNSAVTIGGGGVDLTGGGQQSNGGAFSLSALGDITVNSNIVTAQNEVFLNSAGSIVVDANIVADNAGSSETGTITLLANDRDVGGSNYALSYTSDTNFIGGTGTLYGGTVNLNVGEGPGGLSGGIGTQAQPLNLGGSSVVANISLSAGTFDGDVYLTAASGVSFDLGPQGTSIDLTALNVSEMPTGNFNLTAAGPISQTHGISVNDLNLTTTGAGDAIVLNDGGDGGSDPGNNVLGTARFTTGAGGDVTFVKVGGGLATLGDSNIGGDLTVTVDGDLSIRDDANPSTAAVIVAGNASLTAAGDIAEGTSLHGAGNNITNYIPIQARDLTVRAGTAGGGNIALTNPGNVISGTLRLSNQVGNDYGTQVVNNGDMTLGAVNLAGDFSLTVGSGGGITLADDGEKVQADNVSLTADGDIMQDLGPPLQILTSGNLSATSNFGAVDLSYFDNIVGGTVALNAAGNASFVNSVDTTLVDSVVGGSLSVSTNDDSQSSGGHSAINIGGTLTVAGDTSLHASGDITNFNSDDSLTTTGLSLLSDNGIIGSDGAIRLNGYQGGPVVIKDIETNGMDVSLYSTSAVSVAGLGEGNAVQLAGGIFSLTALGDITVAAPISSVGGLIHLDTTGNIAVNADIIAEDQFSGSGAVWLTANDGNLGAGTANDNGISSTGGTVTASYLILNVGKSAGGISGGIGSLEGQLHLDTFNPDSNDVSVSVKTYGGDVFLNSAKGISFDLPFDQGAPEQVAVNLLSDPIAPGLSGNLFVNAAGAIDQTYGIQVRDLTLKTTGSDGFITLSATSCGCGDPGNQIDGVVRISTEQADAFLANDRSLTLGDSDIHGQAQFVASDPNSGTAHISVDDPNGGTLRVQGHLTLYADTDIQGPGAIATGDGLDAQAFDGSVNLVNSANAVQGDISLTSSETGLVHFANSVDTNILQLGGLNSDSNPVPASSIEVTVADGRGLTHPNLTVSGTVAATGSITLVADGDVTLASGAAVTGDSGDIVLAAGGNFINQAGSQAIQFTGGGRWLIYSDNPADDMFGQLNSNNTAIFGTTYPAAISATGNRYVFAQSAILTITATDAAKTYGVDDSAALASGYTITATPLSVGDYSEAFLPGGNDASFSGAPLISSLGAGSGANVGVYEIVASLGSLQVNGYQVVFQNAHLTVTPATLSYTANAATRSYGAANPAFSGGVIGFVNGDTLASATSGNLVFASGANAASGVGLYAINGSGLNAANYVFVQAAANNTALTITPATLVYLANAATRPMGDANPAFGGSVSGFVNGETLASATSGLLVFTTDAGPTSVPGSYAINGSGLSAANYVFVQAPGNATALTITTPITPPAPITPAAPPDTGPLTGDTKTALMGFIAGASKPPVLSVNQGPPNVPLPPPAPPPPAPPPPPGGSPLAANNTTADGTPAEAPNSSDQATSDVVASLDGGGSGSDGGGAAVIIPGVLTGAPPPPPPPVDAASLPGFGNSSLWQ